MKHIQLAKLYRSGEFFGYGLAVDGELLNQQVDTNILTEANKLPYITASFYLKEQQAENPIIIHLDQHEQTEDVTAKA
ncbi:hypothetical protein BJ925_3689 [Rahnella aquatilis]|nr:hypothetical protein BJ925_3689 [Rahnella aquatilis]